MARSLSGAIIDGVVAAGVADWFRLAGFTRKSRSFFRGQGVAFSTASIQASKINMPHAATCAVNLGVEWPFLYEIWTGQQPRQNPAVAPTLAQARLDPQHGVGKDFWWPAKPGCDAEAIAKEIVDALGRFAQDFWDHYSDLDRVLNDFETGVRVPTGTRPHVVHAALLVRAGRLGDARNVLVEANRRWSHESNSRVAERLGLEQLSSNKMA